MSMIPKTTKASTGIATAKINAAGTSIVNAMIIAPNTTKGERKKSLSVKFTPFCSWFISLVILVIIVDVPILSNSL